VNISVVGLGKLGSPMAACYAAKGFRVVGVDLNAAFVDKIQRREPPVFEPGLADLLARCGDNLTATTDLAEAVRTTDVSFLIVPTPSEASGAFSMKHLIAAGHTIAQALRDKSKYHVVVVTSTVMPGDTLGTFVPVLEAGSGKRCGVDFGVCYSPEFVSLGSVIRDTLHPDFLLIGESDERAGEVVAAITSSVVENQPRIMRMNFVNAELCKLALNNYVTMKISFANMLAGLCEKLPGGNVDAITTALGLDSRIGGKYLRGAVGFGGPCFPRDNHALISLANSVGVAVPLPVATERINRLQMHRLTSLVCEHLPPAGTVSILGLAYKPDTNVIEQAQGVELADYLSRMGVEVCVFDPCAQETTRAVLGDRITYADSARICAQMADVLVVTTPAHAFRDVTPADVTRTEFPVTLIDCWRMFDRADFAPVCTYIGVGTDDVRTHAKPLLLQGGRRAA
jgi:UDPglucose 6-dehydrogenase